MKLLTTISIISDML